MPKLQSQSPYFAAIDLGSNSFHMLIVRVANDKVEVIDREKDMVQIARGLDKNNILDADTVERAKACLLKFSDRLRDIPKSQIRAVGTRTLRSANNSDDFILQAQHMLGAPIQVISGFEEARLIYNGLFHSVASDNKQRLAIDIGGASTELVLGLEQTPILLESLNLGCASFTKTIIQPNDGVNEKSMKKVMQAAAAQLEIIRKSYLKKGWEMVFGTSGTIKCIAELLKDKDGGAIISREGLDSLIKKTIEQGGVNNDNIPKLRREVLPAGIAILHAVFSQLNLEKMYVSDSTLKEGLIYDTIGRFKDIDAREASVKKLKTQYHIDEPQGDRINKATLNLWRQIDGPTLDGISRTKLLKWAAQLHEIGLSISHSGHHHHGHYLLANSDLAGFSRYEQFFLANLVRFHRKKINIESITGMTPEVCATFLPLLVCLRIAVCLHRRREDIQTPTRLTYEKTTYQLFFEPRWLEENPLILAGLQQEVSYFKRAGITLTINSPTE